MIEVHENEFTEYIQAHSGEHIIIDFWAPWCGPCKAMEPALLELEKKYPDIRFVKFNVEDSTSVVNRYGIRSVPTLLFLSAGKPYHQFVGAQTPQVIEAKVLEMQRNGIG